MNYFFKGSKIYRSLAPVYFVMIVLFIMQFFLWFFKTSKAKVDFIITPLPPSKLEMSLFSFGDKELLYRFYGFQLQNAGDTFGETSALQDYDYEKLEKWFYALDELDGISEYVPSIAGLYYSASQYQEDNRYVVNYLVDYARRDLKKNWKWLVTATYIAKFKLQDSELAFNISKDLVKLDRDVNIPLISRLMALSMFSYNELRSCQAVKLITELLNEGYVKEIFDNPESFGAKNNLGGIGLVNVLRKKIMYTLKDKQLVENCLKQI